MYPVDAIYSVKHAWYIVVDYSFGIDSIEKYWDITERKVNAYLKDDLNEELAIVARNIYGIYVIGITKDTSQLYNLTNLAICRESMVPNVQA